MTFSLSALIVVAALAVVLALVCYHLLGRLERLERAVQGGLEPPSARLSREQFERRFRIAHARSNFARDHQTGLIIVVGPEFTADHEIARTLEHITRRDLITVLPASEVDREMLGVTTTPYLFVVDEAHVRGARPVAASADLLALLQQFA